MTHMGFEPFKVRCRTVENILDSAPTTLSTMKNGRFTHFNNEILYYTAAKRWHYNGISQFLWYSPMSDKYRLYSQATIGVAQANFFRPTKMARLKVEPAAQHSTDKLKNVRLCMVFLNNYFNLFNI